MLLNVEAATEFYRNYLKESEVKLIDLFKSINKKQDGKITMDEF